MGYKQIFIAQLGACTRSINAEIKKTIVQVGAVKSGRMKNNTKVKVAYDFDNDSFSIREINSTKYYTFVDQGTKFIAPREITDKTMNKKEVQNALDKLFDVWMDYMIDRQFE